MNARQQFTLPHHPWSIEADALAIDAEQNRLSELRQTARKIIARGPREALCVCLRDTEVVEWTDAAQRFLDGDADDLEFLMEREFGVGGYGSPDIDFARDERAEQSVWGML